MYVDVVSSVGNFLFRADGSTTLYGNSSPIWFGELLRGQDPPTVFSQLTSTTVAGELDPFKVYVVPFASAMTSAPNEVTTDEFELFRKGATPFATLSIPLSIDELPRLTLPDGTEHPVGNAALSFLDKTTAAADVDFSNPGPLSQVVTGSATGRYLRITADRLGPGRQLRAPGHQLCNRAVGDRLIGSPA